MVHAPSRRAAGERLVRREESAAELIIDQWRALRVLGLPPGASTEEIKNAWRDLANVWHPDRFQHEERLRNKAGENLKRINEAYESLREYDPALQPRISARIRESVSAILGMGELGAPPQASPAAAEHPPFQPTAPIGLRRSLRILGLGTVRRTGEVKAPHGVPRRAWRIAAMIVLVVLVAVLLVFVHR